MSLLLISILVLSTFSKIIGVSSEAGPMTTAEGLENEEYELVMPNGDVYAVPWNPAFWDMRGTKPLRTINDTESDDPRKLGRVIGGGVADQGEVPYQAGVMLNNIGLYCGGSIYSADTIITAAHCFFEKGQPLGPEEFVVVVGKSELGHPEPFEMVRVVTEVLIHPSYNTSKQVFNDLAIVRLKQPLCFNVHVQPLPIASKDLLPTGDATISGWGHTLRRKNGSPHHPHGRTTKLKSGKVRIVQPDDCAQQYLDMGLPGHVVADASFICAGLPDGSTDSCQGDSGGPLACRDWNGDFVLCGIVSSGIGCGQPKSPAIYTSIPHFHDWILANAGPPDEPCF